MDDVEGFVEHLVVLGRSSYTLRSYRLGVEHFRRWLGPRSLDEVTRAEVGEYVAAFESGDEAVSGRRAARTVNHRLAALAAFYGFLIERDNQRGTGRWLGRENPVPTGGAGSRHGMPGRDTPRRVRLELRRREPRVLPRDLDPAVGERLAAGQSSLRDRAIVLLLLRTGQRVGDWSDEHGRHGVLGMRGSDVDRRRRTVTVRLKGARDEHRVPVTDDWWPVLEQYLRERGSPTTPALWVGRRQGAGRPLHYPAFEASFRATAQRLGVRATPHMLRHTVAQMLIDVAGVHVAQQVLGHGNVSTTVDEYAHVDHEAMLTALVEVAHRQRRAHLEVVTQHPQRYAFAYSPETIAALEGLGPGRTQR